MANLIRNSHNVSLLMYHFVFTAKYRRLVIEEDVDTLLKDVCTEISKFYEKQFLETVTVGDHAHFFDSISSDVYIVQQKYPPR